MPDRDMSPEISDLGAATHGTRVASIVLRIPSREEACRATTL
jgi:hypothetical protein